MKNKKGKKKLPKVALKIVFNYTSVCCGEPGKKPTVRRSEEDRAENKFSECGLGTWRCTKCGKKCKVKRSKSNPDKESDGAATADSTTSTEAKA